MKTKLIAVAAGALLLTPALNAINYAAIESVLDNITVNPPGNTSIDVTKPIANDIHWSITGAGGSIATIIIELAGYANINTFGLYDPTNPANAVQVFSGPQGQGAQAVVSILQDGSVLVNFDDSGVDFAGNCFGYYLDTPENTPNNGIFYSNPGLNTDGKDHMLAYRGNNSDVIKIANLAPGVWTVNEYALFWEDLNNLGDQDYDDFVVMVESVIPCPDGGATVALLGAGMLGLIALRRKQS